MQKILTVVLLIGLLFGNSYALKSKFEKLDSLFQLLEKYDKFMGSIAIAHNSQIIYYNAIGYDDITSGKKSTTMTKYRIGSVSKMFTASLIFIAVEESKLDLNQTIDIYFPDIENAEKITINNLLNHRSGIYSFTDNDDYQAWKTQKKSEQELLEIINKSRSLFEPDNKAQYSNSNYILLTFILERTYNKSFGELLKEKIFDSLGLKNTYMGKKIMLQNNECNSYKYSGNWILEKETDMSIPLGGGGIVSNPIDLTIYIENLFAGNIISEENLKQMTTLRDNYGMGIFQFPFHEKKCFGHTGGIDGFSSFLGYLPENNLSIALTSNGSNYNDNDILIAALSSFYNRTFNLPSFNAIDLEPEDLEQYLGIYASKQLPLKLTITKKGNTLIAQATGQSAFNLEPTDTHIFQYTQAGIVMVFNPEHEQLTLKQAGGVYMFTRGK